MTKALREMHRVLRSNGYVAFEVGEVLKGTNTQRISLFQKA